MTGTEPIRFPNLNLAATFPGILAGPHPPRLATPAIRLDWTGSAPPPVHDPSLGITSPCLVAASGCPAVFAVSGNDPRSLMSL